MRAATVKTAKTAASLTGDEDHQASG